MRSLGMAILAAMVLGGCASEINYITNEYSGISVVEVVMPDDAYRVFDKPSANKLMITSSLGSAVGQGLAAGFTAGVASGPPKPLFEAAASKFLQDTGRGTCRILDTYLLARPQWEVKYDCTPAALAAPVSRSRPTARRATAPQATRPASVTTSPAPTLETQTSPMTGPPTSRTPCVNDRNMPDSCENRS